MNDLTLSLIVGLLLASSSAWVVSRIIDRYTKWEKNLCRILFKRGKKEDPPTLPFSPPEGLGPCLIPGGSGETGKKDSPAPRNHLIHTFQARRKNRPGSRRIAHRHATQRGIS